jgi:TolB protein
VVGANGTGLRRLTHAPARDSEPAWTGARGGWVAFRRGRNLFRIRPDGTGLRRLTRRGGIDPAWSPHGTRIAFTRRADVYVMRADGRRLHRLTRRGGTAPIWSPDLWAMRSSGRGARALIAGDVTLGGFDWGRQR